MRAMQELAGAMAQAAITVPQHFRGKAGDCLAVVMQAAQWGMNPFAVAQKTHVVNGQLGYEAQLVNAVVQASGAIHGRFHYEYRGDGASLECRVGAVIHGETAITFNEWLSTSSVAVKNSPLWKTNPRQQLGYLQVKNWARQYTPGAILGVYTPDELAQAEPLDMGVAEVVIKEKPSSSDRKELAPYPAEKFDENLSTWDEAIRAGKTTASRVIAMVSSKYLLSEAQCAAIRELGAAPVPAAEQEIDPFVADMEAAENMLGEQA
ncbi:MAG: recombinase RecT [Betaproteobacteria bacterium]|nr:recombinase RecT [Betaproteobacteria bacterium]